MSRGSISEMLLTVGLLLATFILLIQLKNLISLQQKKSESVALERFAKDLDMLVQKASSSSSNIFLEYKPSLKKYELEIKDNKIYLKDKISGITSYIYFNNINIENIKFEDKEKICIAKTVKITTEEKNQINLKFGIADHWWWLKDYKDQFIELYKDLGVTNVRIEIDWAQFDKNTGYDWSSFDDILTSLEENDIEVIGLFVSIPPYLSENREECEGNQLSCKISKDRSDKFIESVKEVVKRYPQIKYWEFWNEPEMWDNMKDPNEYKFWLNLFYDSVKSIDKSKVVASSTLTGWNFIGQIYDSSKMDAIAYHPYSSNFINVNEIEKIKEEVSKRGHNKKIWLTEYGWQSSVLGEDAQAKNLEQTLNWIKEKDYIEIANLHMLHDWESKTYGLVGKYPDFQKKKSYFVFQKIANQNNEISNSKLGIQTQFLKPGVMNFIKEGKPKVVKLMSNYEKADEIKLLSPKTFIVGRIYESDQKIDISLNSKEEARKWFERNRITLQNSKNIDCWEGYNEPIIFDDNLMKWYSDFEIERMKLLESIGKKACIGTFSVGQPQIELWESFKDAINYATKNNHYLSLHEYGYKSMNGNFGEWVGRYKKVYEKYGFNLPLLITETGIDEAGDPEMSGWRAHTNAEEYMNQLKWYDEIIKQDDYVIGATIFHYGLYDWNSFEIYPDLTGNDGTNGPLVKYLKQSIENNNKKTIKYIISESNIIEILPNQCPAILIKKPFTTTTITKTLSFSWPLENYKIYSLTSCFGWRKLDGFDNFHTGIDIGTPEGTEIKAAFDGKVLKIRNGDGSDLLTGYGNYVILEHDLDGKKYYSFYGHLKCSGVIVKESDTVKTGDIIGYSGGVDKCKGTSTGAHLHFEIREGENNIRGSVNPCLFLDDCGCKKECESYNQKDDEYKCPKS